MTTTLTRRQFLQAAGGVTFMALIPTGNGAYAAPGQADNSLLFVVSPYIQPGPASALVDGHDTLVVAWQTNYVPAQFEVSYGPTKSYGTTAVVTTGERISGRAQKQPSDPDAIKVLADQELLRKRLNYSALLTGLKLGRIYYYRVRCAGTTIVEGYASTRKPPGMKFRFVAFGDNSFGDVSDRAIAFHTYSVNPDFVMNTGDNVYDSGLDNEYARYFFPAYNADLAGLHVGAPLLRSVPFYSVIANHDVAVGTATGPVADFNASRDSLGFYTAMHLPMNGPQKPTNPTPTVCSDPVEFARFASTAGDRFPRMANYSFDYGDMHLLCLDSNDYINPTDAALQSWIATDLTASNSLWKVVVCHHPPFNVGENHYAEQQMRALVPLFEKHDVDMVLSGHEHTYQRTMPVRFTPGDMSNAALVGTKDRRIPGVIVPDSKFDGIKNTKADGIIYITTGAGGKELYDPGFGNNPTLWKTDPGQAEPYIAKFHSRSHSLTIIDVDGGTLNLQQMTEFGEIIDRVTVTKA